MNNNTYKTGNRYDELKHKLQPDIEMLASHSTGIQKYLVSAYWLAGWFPQFVEKYNLPMPTNIVHYVDTCFSETEKGIDIIWYIKISDVTMFSIIMCTYSGGHVEERLDVDARIIVCQPKENLVIVENSFSKDLLNISNNDEKALQEEEELLSKILVYFETVNILRGKGR